MAAEDQGQRQEALASQEGQSITPAECSGNNCCYKNAECVRKCNTFFMGREDQKRCSRFSVQWVHKIEETLNQIEGPNRDNLQDIELPVLSSVIKISEKTWINKINNYSKAQARAVLFWLASQPEVSASVLGELSFEPVRLLLVALLRKNTRSVLLDDNALLSGLKEPITKEEEDTFLKVSEQTDNWNLISLVHRQVVTAQLCDYPINQPQPVYSSQSTHEACVLVVYCHLTGSYNAGQYSSAEDRHFNEGQSLREAVASSELGDDELDRFISSSVEEGGLGVTDDAGQWQDSACVKLTELWEDGNLKFGL